jgi:putrescine transport system substrate-binding protein
MRKIFLLVFFSLCLAPCASGARAQFTPPAKPVEPTVTLLGWADYVAPGVMEDYARDTGVRVVYDVYDSEAGFEARLAEAKGFYDIVIAPARLLPKMIAAGQLQKLDRNLLPNARDVWPEIAGKLALADPGNQYALAHMWFAYGLAYDRKKAAERLPEAQIASWETLFRPDALKKFSNCGVQLPDDADLVLQAALMAQRLAPDLRGMGDIKRAGEAAARLRANVTEFRSGGRAAALADGETCLALVSAGEAAQARAQGKAGEPPLDIGFAVPREGAPLAIDALTLLKDAPHATEAARFAAYLQRPEVALKNSALAQLASGVAAVRPLLGPEARADKIIWLEDETIRRLALAPAPDPALRKAIEREWLKVKTGSYEPAPLPAAAKKLRPGAKPEKPEKPAKPGDKAAPAAPAKKPKRPGGKAEG